MVLAGLGWLGWAGTGTETSPVLPYTVSSSTQQPTPGTTPGDITCTRRHTLDTLQMPAYALTLAIHVEHSLLIYLHDGALVAVLVQAEECQVVPRSNVWKICAAAAIQTPCKNT